MIEGAPMVPALTLPEFSVPAVPPGRRNPGRQEISAEGQNDIGVLNVEIGQNILLEHVLHGGSIHVVVDGLVVEVLRPHHVSEAGCEKSKVSPIGPRDEHGAGASIVELPHQGVHRLRLPVNGVKPPRTADSSPFHGTGYPVRVV